MKITPFFKNLYQFIFSKVFLLQIVIALVICVLIGYGSLEWLESSTNHNQHVVVPRLSKKTIDEAKSLLKIKNLELQIREDSSNFDPSYPRYSIIEQDPSAGSAVKKNRKIYVTLNPSGYKKIEVPNIIRQTRRQAEPMLIASGFKIGSITYKPNMSDHVLEMRYKGSKLEPGTLLMKTSTIDLIVGDGEGIRLNLSSSD